MNSTVAAYEQYDSEEAQAISNVKESLSALLTAVKNLPVISTIIHVSNVLIECRKAYKGLKKIQKKNLEKENLLENFKAKEAELKKQAEEEEKLKAKEEEQRKIKEEAEQKAKEAEELRLKEEKIGILKAEFEKLEFQYQKVHKLGLETITQLHHGKDKIENFASALTKVDEDCHNIPLHSHFSSSSDLYYDCLN